MNGEGAAVKEHGQELQTTDHGWLAMIMPDLEMSGCFSMLRGGRGRLWLCKRQAWG